MDIKEIYNLPISNSIWNNTFLLWGLLSIYQIFAYRISKQNDIGKTRIKSKKKMHVLQLNNSIPICHLIYIKRGENNEYKQCHRCWWGKEDKLKLLIY